MNSKKDTEEERSKSLELIKILENTSEKNMQDITSLKSKIETMVEKTSLNKNLVQHYEKKMEELFTDVANVQWNQTMARTFLKSDAQFVENYKTNISNDEPPTEVTVQEKSLTNTLFDLKQEKENLENYCNANYRIIEELSHEYTKLRDECAIYEENKDTL